uniref:Uncharacterized protein n=1 Tax=Rhizophora mucronata TaxID=61149 RepID=A0A2P2NQF1_RHIMU
MKKRTRASRLHTCAVKITVKLIQPKVFALNRYVKLSAKGV